VIKTFISAAVLLSLPVAAFASERTFTHDGVTYAYTREQRGETVVLSGRVLPNGAPYTLNVRGRKVTGHVDGTPVAFTIAKPLTKTVETAQR